MESVSLHQLPDFPLLNILSFLSYADLTKCHSVCRHLRELSSYDPLWHRQCKIYWLIKTCPEGQSWRESFIAWYIDFGKYVDVYRVIRQAWNDIESYIERFCPRILESLEAGLTEAEIESNEVPLEQKLPLDLRCSYRIHGGQRLDKTDKPPGLLGSVMYAGIRFSEYLMQPFCMVKVYGENYIALTHSYSQHQFQILALNDHIGFIRGQVFYYSVGGVTKTPAAGEFISACSYSDWLTTYAKQLANGAFPIVNQHIYRFYHEPESVAVTGNMTVSVATAFIASQSQIDPPQFVHAYRITLSMDEKASKLETSQLESRSWIITDEDGKEENVVGPGVVGAFPIMSPGSTFTWVSSTSFRTTYGSMKGHFVMRNLASGARFEVACPTFHMKCLPYQTIVDRRERALRSKKDR